VAERRFQAGQPRRLPLVAERLHMQQTRVAERGNEQEYRHRHAADRHTLLAEIDLQLTPRRRLEPQCRPGLRCEFGAEWRHRTLQRAQRHHDPAFPRQVLAHDIGIAVVADQPLAQPCGLAGQLRATPTAPVAMPLTRGQVVLHRRPATAKLARDPPRPPTNLMQPKHRCHCLRRLHQRPPRLCQPRRVCRFMRHVHPSPSSRGDQISLSPPDQFSLSPDTVRVRTRVPPVIDSAVDI
jgi:hypothetical protein